MRLIGYYNYTVIATYLGLASAGLGCYYAVQGDSKQAFCCLLLAGGFDMIDGRIAATRKRTADEKSFGIQIDSLCDLVSFGVLPALILNVFPLPGPLRILLGIAFTLAAIIRLSYFNVSELNRQASSTERRKFYEGMPVTTVALLLPFLYLFSPLLGERFGWFYAFALASCALLFLLPFKLKKACGREMVIFAGIGILTVFGMLFLV